MNANLSDADLARIQAVVANAPALTSDQIAELRRLLQPDTLPARQGFRRLPAAAGARSRKAA